MKKALIISLFFLTFALALSSTSSVYAQDNGTDLNLTSFPLMLADKLSISDFAGGILASLLLMMTFILPTALWTKSLIPPLFIGLVCLGACIALGWLGYWFLIVLAVLVALMFAGKMRAFIGGGARS